MSDQYIDGVWAVFDVDGNGTLDAEEFEQLYKVLLKRDDAVVATEL